ncbi:MAG TPA: TIM barrel protein [Anaerolineae bacterium]
MPELARLVGSLGFDGIELPVRPGFQVEPGNVLDGLRTASRIFEDRGLHLYSVAGPADERTISACAECHIPLIRIIVPVEPSSYFDSVERCRIEFDKLVPILSEYGVTLGIQNHSDSYVCNAMGLHHLLDGYNPLLIGAVWDAAHNALNGEDPEMALNIVWSHLRMVNLKNAYWKQATNTESDVIGWRPYWTTGNKGLASWPRVAAELKRRSYSGVVCLPAEYSDESQVESFVREDLRLAKQLFQDAL